MTLSVVQRRLLSVLQRRLLSVVQRRLLSIVQRRFLSVVVGSGDLQWHQIQWRQIQSSQIQYRDCLFLIPSLISFFVGGDGGFGMFIQVFNLCQCENYCSFSIKANL